MKPEYANGFTISHNPELEEMILTFIHQYPEGDSIETAEVARIAISTTAARELYKRLPDVLPKE